MKNSILGRWLIALQHVWNQKLFPFNLDVFFTSLDSLNKKKNATSLRVVHKKQTSSPLKDDRAKLFIVKPRSLK